MAITPGKKDFIIYQGATWRYVITWKAGADAYPVDLTGYAARMHCRCNIASSTPFLELTTENGRITLGDELGTIALELLAEDTAEIQESGVYDLELVAPDGTVMRLLMGSIAISREVTR